MLVDAHGMEPDAVFALLKDLGGDIPKLLVSAASRPRCRAMGLSLPVAGAVDQAVAVVRELLGEHETGEEDEHGSPPGAFRRAGRPGRAPAQAGTDLARYFKIRSM